MRKPEARTICLQKNNAKSAFQKLLQIDENINNDLMTLQTRRRILEFNNGNVIADQLTESGGESWIN